MGRSYDRNIRNILQIKANGREPEIPALTLQSDKAMKIQRNLPSEFPNGPYYADLVYTDEYAANRGRHLKRMPEYKPYIRVILRLYTPTGRLSKYYQTIKLNLDHVAFQKTTPEEALEYATYSCIKEAKKAYKQQLRKGYKLSDVYILGAHIPKK